MSDNRSYGKIMRACLRALCIRRPAVDGGVFVSRKYVTLDKRRVMLASWISNAKQEATETWKDAAPAERFAIGSPVRRYSPTAVTAVGASAKPAPPAW